MFGKCVHSYRVVRQENYIDFSECRVLKITYACTKCNREKVKKFLVGGLCEQANKRHKENTE